MSLYKPIERIQISKSDLLQIENQIRFQEHIRRYASARRFLYGKVLDFACGCGYGSHLLSTNPEVSKVVGVDKDEESIAWAKKEFETAKCEFRCVDVLDLHEKFDTLISLETIEHFENNDIYHQVLKNCQIDQLILSYPNKKSTHFNPFHVRDVIAQDVCTAFPDFVLVHRYLMGDVDFLILIRKPAAMPSHIYQNISDLRS
ncbi:MAG TPA: class I SAM-dependent methyltransferase [Flavisolibacter sp.]|nr:class I SAM-dependent methyltransferase [Flavisolibacter sp.]